MFRFTCKEKLENYVRSGLKVKCPFLLSLICLYFLYAFRTVRLVSLLVASKGYERFYVMILKKYPILYFNY